jgi:DHA1 family tetracycline resistance protein-like MFS transporter
MARTDKSPLGLIFLTIFIDMVGFGIMIPVLPVYAEGGRFGATPWQLGFLVGIYSLLQLVFSPVFGKLSDKVGRKPVLVFSILGTAVGFVVLGAAQNLAMLFLGRVIDGASGGNISTAQACIADVTPPEKRAKSMALIGVAFGLGFIFGPALGGWIGGRFGLSAPFYFAAGLALLNLVLVAVFLPETLRKEDRIRPDERAGLMEVFEGGKGPLVGRILGAYFASIAGFSMMTGLFALFCEHQFRFGGAETANLLAYVGVLGMVVQGGLVRRLMKKPREKQLAMVGAAVLAFSLFLMPLAGSLAALMAVCAGIALGNGFTTPMLNGLVSRCTSARAQGRVLGLMQSAGSLGRFVGPVLAFWLLPLDLGRAGVPYARTAFWVGAALLLAALILVWGVKTAPGEVADAREPHAST